MNPKANQVVSLPRDEDVLAEAERLHVLGVVFRGDWKGCTVVYIPAHRSTITVTRSDWLPVSGPETTETNKTDEPARFTVRIPNRSVSKHVVWDSDGKPKIVV
jgi:hypothetical protein